MWTNTPVSGLMRRITSLSVLRHSVAATKLEIPRRTFSRSNGSPKEENVYLSVLNNSMKSFQKESRRFAGEVKERFKLDPPRFYLGDVVPVYRFATEEDVAKFHARADSSTDQGFSKSQLIRTNNGTAIFEGVLDTRVPKDGKTKQAGVVFIQTLPHTISFNRRRYFDWLDFTHFVVRCRGDGRTYSVNLSVEGDFEDNRLNMYQYPLHTRGGPHWQTSYIPFSKFFLSNNGRVLDRQPMIHLTRVYRVGIALADTYSGPFKLELDLIGLAKLHVDDEVSAYEYYEATQSFGYASQ